MGKRTGLAGGNVRLRESMERALREGTEVRRESVEKLRQEFPQFADRIEQFFRGDRSMEGLNRFMESVQTSGLREAQAAPLGGKVFEGVTAMGASGVGRVLAEQGLRARKPQEGEKGEVIVEGTPRPGTESAKLQEAAIKAQGLEPGRERGEFFNNEILPTLAEGAARRFETSEAGRSELAGLIVEFASAGTLGAAQVGKGLKEDRAPDTNYPPRGAHDMLRNTEFYTAFGVRPDAVTTAEGWLRQIEPLKNPDPNKYGPSVDQVREVSPEIARAFERVTEFYASGSPSFRELSSAEQALAVNMLANNIGWHSTNFQRAAGDATRGDVTLRDGVFNTYPVNLALQQNGRGLNEAVEMVLIDASQYARKGLPLDGN